MVSPLGLAASVLYRAGHIFRHFRKRETWRRFRIAAERYHTSTARVALRALQLYRVGRFLPEESLSRGLVDPAVPLSEHEHHFSEERLHGLQIAINSPHAEMCRDKVLFHAYCHQHGLPTPRLLGILSAHGSRSHDGTPLCTEDQWHDFVRQLPESFIVKPRAGNQGRDVRLMGTGPNPDPEKTGALIGELQRLARDREDYLIEERLVVHPDIARLTGTEAISTLRIITLVTEQGVPEIMDGYARIIVNDSITDNIGHFETGKYSGNMLACIDLATGRITRSWVPNADGVGYRWVEHHPRTDLPLIDFSIPFWGELQDLVRIGATCFLPIRTIGWDIAITAAGPILIESNERYKYSASGQSVLKLRKALTGEHARLKRYKSTRDQMNDLLERTT